jgi:hypothetical protein
MVDWEPGLPWVFAQKIGCLHKDLKGKRGVGFEIANLQPGRFLAQSRNIECPA